MRPVTLRRIFLQCSILVVILFVVVVIAPVAMLRRAAALTASASSADFLMLVPSLGELIICMSSGIN